MGCRYASQEPSYREHSLGGLPYAGSLAPLDPEGKLAQRRWNSCASIMSDASLVGSPTFGSLASHGGFPGSILPNLTGPESQAFLQALQQRCQVSFCRLSLLSLSSCPTPDPPKPMILLTAGFLQYAVIVSCCHTEHDDDILAVSV